MAKTDIDLEDLIIAVVTRAAHDLVAAVRQDVIERASASLGAPVAAAKPSTPRKAPAPAPAAKAKKPARKGKFVRRSSEEIADVLQNVRAFIGRNPGVRGEQILKEVGGDKAAVKDALTRLRNDQQVKTSGIKRGMTYTAV